MARGLRPAVLVAVSAVAVAASVLPWVARADAGGTTIEVLSNRTDLVSGGDALVAVNLPAGTDPAAVTMNVGATDVTDQFAMRPNGRYEGLLTGLADGDNVLEAHLADGTGARITITNHSIDGPVFSGPQLLPWSCADDAKGPQCSRPPSYSYLYKSSSPGSCTTAVSPPVALPVSVGSSCLKAYDPKHPPSDVATTTTDQGHTVPYIVRLETGNEDRDQYQIASLYNPKTGASWKPWSPYAGWNGKLEIAHGAACGTAHGEGTAPGVLDDEALSRGFAVMATALDNAGHNCNIAVQAESLVMAKEHLIEELGPVRYTIATGCSGGSLTQMQVGNAYPGIYDGLTPQCTFPDAWSSAMDVFDCYLMEKYWENPARWAPGVVWTERSEAAAGGHFSDSVCHAWKEVFPFWQTGEPSQPKPTDGENLQGCGVAADASYDHDTNRTGVRCSLSDYMVNVLGVRPASAWSAVERSLGYGFANRPAANVGVEYGRQALESGAITPQQFVDLNAKVGGLDIDFRPTVGRVHADPEGVVAAYRSGAVNETTNLDRVPIIDQPLDNVEIHEEYRAWAISAREDRALGSHANHVIWYGQGAGKPDAFLTMDAWLAAVEKDHGAGTTFDKIVRARQKLHITDHCYLGAENVPTQELCQKLMGPYEGTRAAAGGPFAGDVIDCALKPLRRADFFPVQLSDDEWKQLHTTFPSGVCDYSKPGFGQQPTIPWQQYGTATDHVYGGAPLGSPPVSTPLSAGQ